MIAVTSYYRHSGHEVDVVAFGKELRWGLVPTLMWVATRDLKLTADSSGKSFERADISLASRRAFLQLEGGTPPAWRHDSLRAAWENDVAEKMAIKKITAVATRVRAHWDGGFTMNTPGVIFPPDKAKR